MGSWKTTAAGVGTIVCQILAIWFPEFAGKFNQIAVVLTGLGLAAARDNNVTSEQAGLKPTTSLGANVGKVVGLLAMGFVCLMLSGCALWDKAATGVSAPVVTARVVTNTVPEIQVVTNFVTTTVQLPGQTNVVTNLVVQVVTNFVPVTRIETVSVTNWVEKASIAQGVNIATNVAGFVPAPFGTAATAGLGIVSGLLALLVRRKNQQAGELTAANDSLTTQLQAVVKGVEQVTTVISPEVGIKVKGIIAETSKALGVADDLHATVQAATKV